MLSVRKDIFGKNSIITGVYCVLMTGNEVSGLASEDISLSSDCISSTVSAR
jgi:hypothetical protein